MTTNRNQTARDTAPVVQIDPASALAPINATDETGTAVDMGEVTQTAEYVVKDQDKADAFKRLAGKRVAVILDKFDILANCGNRNQYEYTPEQVERIRSALQTKLDFVMNAFAPKAKHVGKTFEL